MMDDFKSLNKKAFFAVINKVSHGKARHLNKNGPSFIASVATEKKYYGCIKNFFIWCRKNNHSTSKVTAHIAEQFLQSKSFECVQKTIDAYRQAISLVFDIKPHYIASAKSSLLTPRAYLQTQITHLLKVASPTLNFSIRLAAATGMRSIELDTISRISDISESEREWLPERFFGRESDVIYVVIGKGGLRRCIRVPPALSLELEDSRLPAATRKTQREIHYKKRYSIVGGHNFSQQFSRLSIQEFGWSTGGHGLRHRYAQDRIMFLQREGFTYQYALKIVAQELGHFSSQNTLAYMR